MNLHEHPWIVWLDDKPDSINRLVERVESKDQFKITLVPKSTQVLSHIVKKTPPGLIIVDLLLNGNDGTGLNLAKTAKLMMPLLPIVAVTEHLDDFCTDITTCLVEENNPLEFIWEKDRLQSEKEITTFTDRLYSLCKRECHVGTLVKMDSDYTQVKLRTPKGDEYERFFKTEFLLNSGMSRAGEEIQMIEESIWQSILQIIYMLLASGIPDV